MVFRRLLLVELYARYAFLVDSMRISLALHVPIMQMTYVGGLHVVRNEKDEMVGVYANNEKIKEGEDTCQF